MFEIRFWNLDHSDKFGQIGIGGFSITKSITNNFRSIWFKHIDEEAKNYHVNGKKYEDKPDQIDFNTHKIHDSETNQIRKKCIIFFLNYIPKLTIQRNAKNVITFSYFVQIYFCDDNFLS